MAYYRQCERCGAHLDPGEICDCIKKAAQDAANIQSGGVEQASHKLSYSTPIVPNEVRRCQA